MSRNTCFAIACALPVQISSLWGRVRVQMYGTCHLGCSMLQNTGKSNEIKREAAFIMTLYREGV